METNANTIQEEPYPEKPAFEEPNNSLSKSFLSVGLFILAFYLFFDRDINFILILVVVLFIHEFGHFLAMKYFKYKELRIFFIPLFGALVTGSKREVTQAQKAIILLAGPIPGIIIGLSLILFGSMNLNGFMVTTGNIFLFLNIFNLLPLTPLDGGQLIETLFINSKGILQTVFTILSAIGLAIIAFYSASYIMLIIPLFLLGRLANQAQISKVISALDDHGIDYKKPFEDLSDKEYWLIRDQVLLNMRVFQKISPYEYIASDKEKMIQNTMKTLYLEMPIVNLTVMTKLMFVIIWLVFILGPFILLSLIVLPYSL